MAIFPWDPVKHLLGLWISLIEAIPQVGRKTRLIYDFSWRNLNAKAAQDAPKESMRFVRALN